MNFSLSEEQIGIQDLLKRFFSKEYSFEQRRALAKSADGFSREAWTKYADFGLLALPFPEAVGGLGGNGVDQMVVMEQLGRGLALEPYVPTVVLAGSLIAAAGSAAQQATLLGEVAAGERLLALAHYEHGGRYTLNHVATTARAEDGGWRLAGRKSVVLHAAAADTLVVSARVRGGANDADGISLFLVDRNAPGVRVRSYWTQDGARAAEVVFDGVPVTAADRLGPDGGALPFIEAAIDRGIAALCAEAVGIMTALNEATLEYLKTRKQFGVAIGKFQALQHRMADMTVAAEQARSMAMLAAVTIDSDDAAERRRVISAAKVYVGQQARFVGQQAVQLHGGMGVTDELNVAHWFKRLTMINATFGDIDHHLGRFGESLLAA